MSCHVEPAELLEWCRIPAEDLPGHPDLRVPFRLVRDREEMGELMARELVEVIRGAGREGRPCRAIIPCGPVCWYAPWRRRVREEPVSLRHLTVFHMDECLDWQGRLLPRQHPCNFRTAMERDFYGEIPAEINVPAAQRIWATPEAIETTRAAIAAAPIDVTYGGWGQDGHIAYNQARRHPFSHVSLEDLRRSTMRVQENNLDTVIALAQRNFGSAYQFVPLMSVTLGIGECLAARQVRVFSDTGAWKQTALRVALFSEPTPEYPMTLLQEHPDALITATLETARHPVAEHPEWELL
ncbi:MAG: hypothetical protein ABIL09_15570 [Gemmatimonadota bacterium]